MPKTLTDVLLFDPLRIPQDGEPATATALVGDPRRDIEKVFQQSANRDAVLLAFAGSSREGSRVFSLNTTDLIASGMLRSTIGSGSTAQPVGTVTFAFSKTPATPGSDEWEYLFLRGEDATSARAVVQTTPPVMLTHGHDGSDTDRGLLYLASYYSRASGGIRPFRRNGDETLYDLCSVDPATLRPLNATSVAASVGWTTMDCRPYVSSIATHALVRLWLVRAAPTTTGSATTILSLRDAAGTGDNVAYRTTLSRNDLSSAQSQNEFWVPLNRAVAGQELSYKIDLSGDALSLAVVQILGYRE